MIFLVNGEFASLTKTILPDKYSFNGEDLTIYALGNIAVEQLNWKVSKKFERLLRETFGIETTVAFDNHIDSYDQIAKNEEMPNGTRMKISLLSWSGILRNSKKFPRKTAVK